MMMVTKVFVASIEIREETGCLIVNCLRCVVVLSEYVVHLDRGLHQSK